MAPTWVKHSRKERGARSLVQISRSSSYIDVVGARVWPPSCVTTDGDADVNSKADAVYTDALDADADAYTDALDADADVNASGDHGSKDQAAGPSLGNDAGVDSSHSTVDASGDDGDKDSVASERPGRFRRSSLMSVGLFIVHDVSNLLDPIDRNSEIMFGLFMTLTFTGTISAATAGTAEVNTMMIAVLCCNAAWGFVDGVMYVLRNLVGRGRKVKLMREVLAPNNPTSIDSAHRLISEDIGDLAAAFDTEVIEHVRQWLAAQPESALPKMRVTLLDLRGAFAVFLLVFLSTLPPVLPFFAIRQNLLLAKRISACIAILIMFCCGFSWGKYAGTNPWVTGMIVVVVGGTVEGVIIGLGG
jgi:hypothetical protein